MSNEAIQKHLSQEAVQLSANALSSPDNAGTCIKPAKAPPPPVIRQVPVLPDSRWRKSYLDVCHGDHAAAEVLGNIAFRYQPKSDGTPRLENIRYASNGKLSYWWGHKLEDLASECKLKYEQTRYALRKLTAWGLIETRSAKTPTKMLQVRLPVAAGAASLNGWPDFSNSQIAICENSHKAICENSQIKALMVVEGKSVEVVKAVDESTSTLPGNSQTLTAEMQTAKSKAKPQPLKAYEVWQQNTQKHFPDSYLEPKATDRKNLGPKMRRLYKSGVTDYLAFLEWITTDEGFQSVHYEWNGIWDGDVNKLANPPQWPDLKFLLDERNLAVAVAIYRDVVGQSPEQQAAEAEQQAKADAEYLAEQQAHKIEQQKAIAKANAEIEAIQAAAAAAAPQPVKKSKLAAQTQAAVAKQQATPAPAVEPVVNFLTVDDYEECNEPPLASEKTPLTPEEKRKLSAAKDAANKIKGIKFTASAATLFQHGQPKHAKAAAA